jgi:hypothetical protein
MHALFNSYTSDTCIDEHILGHSLPLDRKDWHIRLSRIVTYAVDVRISGAGDVTVRGQVQELQPA